MEGGGGNNDDDDDDLDGSVCRLLRRDDGINDGGMGGAPIGKSEDKNEEAPGGGGAPKGCNRSVVGGMKRFRSSLKENGDN